MKITDKERLDWLIAGKYHVESHRGDYWVYPALPSGDDAPSERSARAAIDAAIKAERARKREPRPRE